MRGEVVLVTGGSSGIGLATARLFAARGAHVWISARDAAKLRQAASSIPSPVEIVESDVTSMESLVALAEMIRKRDGRLDVLVNSAGQLDLVHVGAESLEVSERLMEVNYMGLIRTVAAMLPLIRLGSRRSIVNLSSLAGRLTPPYWSAYSASKFAVQAYSAALRQELRAEKIHVGIVMPGPVMSPMVENLLHTPMYPVPIGVPVLTPEKVADAIFGCVVRRRAEVTVPGWFGPVLRLAAAFPRLVDLFYRPYHKK